MKKSNKLTTIIITLCILIPAFLLVSLYPKISKVMQEQKKYNEAYIEEMKQEEGEEAVTEVYPWSINSSVVNYFMETSYYLYGEIQEESRGMDVNFDVLDAYGWNNDYEEIRDTIRFHAKDTNDDVPIERKNAETLEEEDTIGCITLTFDAYGYLANADLEGEINVWNDYQGYGLKAKAQKSLEQYKNNVEVYEEEHGVEIDEKQVMPKNFTITFVIDKDCRFVYDESEDHSVDWEHYTYYYTNPERLLWETGSACLIIIAAIFIALGALVLPFFKKLETGWEKIFRAPFEFVIAFIGIGIAGAYGMYCAMATTCAIENFPDLVILGDRISVQTQYIVLLVLNFLGWAALFFLEYIVIASLRQFFCGPKLYIRNRVLFVRIFRWIKKQCVKLYRYVTNIDISSKLNSSIIKIVLANFVILTILCVMWFFGIVGLILYSIALYVLLRHYGEKVQKQFNSILGATKQMAEGNLKIALEEDLGMFKPIGDSLQEIQKGFEKAVVEEAKSQSMKTELITNVSHDLKTPLTAIITYVDLLKKEDLTKEERKAYVQTLDKKSQRLKVLIEDLFEVSKAHSGNVKMNFMDVDIVSLMKQVRMEMSDQIESSNLTYKWNIPDEKIMLSLDGQRTYRVFENLLNNTLKYAMPYSRVYVDVLKDESTVRVVFRNVSAQELDFDPERLTERFVRGDSSRNSEGSGLGLAIAKSFVELQKGKLDIEVDGDLFKVTITW